MTDPILVSDRILNNYQLKAVLYQVLAYQFGKQSRKMPNNWIRFFEGWAAHATDVRMCGNLRRLLGEFFPREPVAILGAQAVHCVLVRELPILLLPEHYDDKPFCLKLPPYYIEVDKGEIVNLVIEGMNKTSYGYALQGLFQKALQDSRSYGSFAAY